MKCHPFNTEIPEGRQVMAAFRTPAPMTAFNDALAYFSEKLPGATLLQTEENGWHLILVDVPVDERPILPANGEKIDGFTVGEIVLAAHDITAGHLSANELCPKGTRLRVYGPSQNGLYPIGVEKESDPRWKIAVSRGNIERPTA